MPRKLTVAADEDMEKANAAASEKLKADLAKSPDEPVEMPVDEPEPEEQEDTQPEGPSGQRDQKRKDRGRQFKQEREAAEQRARDAESAAAQANARAAAAEQYARMNQAQKEPPKSQHEQDIERIANEQTSLNAQFNARMIQLKDQPMPDAELADFRKKAYELQDARTRAVYRSEQAARGPQQDPAEAATRQMLNMTYPDVMSHPNPAVFAYAEAFVRQERIATGVNGQWGPLTRELMDRGMDAARERFRIPKANGHHAPPSEATKRKFVGGPSGPRVNEDTPRTIKMDATRRAIAEAAHPALAAKDPKLAHAKWAQTAGKRLLEQGDE
jgi:hypothetical protein